jgi:hypothetical protein
MSRGSAVLRMALVALIGVPDASAAPTPSHAQGVETPGLAVLRKCRDWGMFKHCKDFNRIAIPGTIRIGDAFDVYFSSNNKDFRFVVRDIVMIGDECRLFDEIANPQRDPNMPVDTLIVQPCTPLP